MKTIIRNINQKQFKKRIMKNFIYLFAVVLLVSSCQEPGMEDPLQYSDSISMGAGYANDIYYSLENGIVKTSPRDAWDIAFSADPMTSTVLINEGLGIELYTYTNGDKDDWDNVDTTGMSWNAIFNSDTTWMMGAFERKATGHPDYGWGVYSSVSHFIVGDSIYIIKLSDGSFKKLFIEGRTGAANAFSIKYGELDESGVAKEVPCSEYATSRNFVYFSFASGEATDLEPEKTAWDLVFTKYQDESINYIVTGVLSNVDLEVAEIRNTAIDMVDTTAAEFTTDISVIGSDWKTFDMGTFSYTIEQDLSYLIKKDSKVYKMVFTGTDGSASGKMVFDVEIIE
jgi:hypothetical protein